ncbi:sensor domain-containing protein [Natronolimnohabitans sp. A-GB9]|uniref:sensor domain-containing protein n=1 Tax=Natronolimnohabitans sp. A-GB9 TaxID=3069757 RepID=UPI0027B460A5|nr:sensor domain-containing protein [Natronolimnohabitans sp. A-GB9]MDQ2051149.1 sensor domain-containing protein [Natronolimnohabitans sp. A-GB9]
MPSSEPPSGTDDFAARDIVGVVADWQTYKNLLYLFLAFLLGFLYMMVVTFGLAFGAILSVFLIGIGILVVTVALCRVLARFERWLANALLAVDLEPAADVDTSATGVWAKSKAYLDAASTWRGTGFLLLKFWIGIVGLILVALFVSSLSVLTAPLRYPLEVEFVTINDEPIAWTIDSLPEAILAVPIGLVVAIVLLHIVNAFAYVCGRIAEALLGETATSAGSKSTTTSSESPGTGTELPVDSWTTTDSEGTTESKAEAVTEPMSDDDSSTDPTDDDRQW